MPIQYGSCLNDEYTEAVKKIYELLKEAKEKYELFPNCIKNVNTEYMGNDLGWFLTNGENVHYILQKNLESK